MTTDLIQGVKQALDQSVIKYSLQFNCNAVAIKLQYCCSKTAILGRLCEPYHIFVSV